MRGDRNTQYEAYSRDGGWWMVTYLYLHGGRGKPHHTIDPREENERKKREII